MFESPKNPIDNRHESGGWSVESGEWREETTHYLLDLTELTNDKITQYSYYVGRGTFVNALLAMVTDCEFWLYNVLEIDQEKKNESMM